MTDDSLLDLVRRRLPWLLDTSRGRPSVAGVRAARYDCAGEIRPHTTAGLMRVDGPSTTEWAADWTSSFAFCSNSWAVSDPFLCWTWRVAYVRKASPGASPTAGEATMDGRTRLDVRRVADGTARVGSASRTRRAAMLRGCRRSAGDVTRFVRRLHRAPGGLAEL